MSTAASSSSAPVKTVADTRSTRTIDPRGYGYNSVSKSNHIKKWVKTARERQYNSIRPFSEVLKNLPFESCILDSSLPLPIAAAAYLDENVFSDFDRQSLMTSAKHVGNWEQNMFCKPTPLDVKDARALEGDRRMVARKLRLVPNDQAMHEPLAIAEQANYFATQSRTNLASWMSCFVPFIAFDFVASHVAPSTRSRSFDDPKMRMYSSLPQDRAIVEDVDKLLGDYQLRIKSWIDAVTAEADSDSGRRGLYDLIRHGTQQEIGGVTMCNVGMTVLIMQRLLKSDISDLENVVKGLNNDIKAEAERREIPLPPNLFDEEKSRLTDCMLPFLCATLISPLTLFTGHRLYGYDASVKIHVPFSAWQNMAHVQRPEVVQQLESDARQLIISMVFGDENVDGLALLTDLAKDWKTLSLDPAHAGFFRGLLVVKEDAAIGKALKLKVGRGLTVDPEDEAAYAGLGSDEEEMAQERSDGAEDDLQVQRALFSSPAPARNQEPPRHSSRPALNPWLAVRGKPVLEDDDSEEERPQNRDDHETDTPRPGGSRTTSPADEGGLGHISVSAAQPKKLQQVYSSQRSREPLTSDLQALFGGGNVDLRVPELTLNELNLSADSGSRFNTLFPLEGQEGPLPGDIRNSGELDAPLPTKRKRDQISATEDSQEQSAHVPPLFEEDRDAPPKKKKKRPDTGLDEHGATGTTSLGALEPSPSTLRPPIDKETDGLGSSATHAQELQPATSKPSQPPEKSEKRDGKSGKNQKTNNNPGGADKDEKRGGKDKKRKDKSKQRPKADRELSLAPSYRQKSAQPKVKIEGKYASVPTQVAERKINNSWRSNKWKVATIDSDDDDSSDEPMVDHQSATVAKPILDWQRAFVVRSLGRKMDTDLRQFGLPSTRPGSDGDERMTVAMTPRTPLKKKRKDSKNTDPEFEGAESDTWNGNSSDVTEDELPLEFNFDAPIRLTPGQQPLVGRPDMVLYDICMAIPKSCRNWNRALFRKIEDDMGEHMDDPSEYCVPWLKDCSLSEWMAKPISTIEADMATGAVFLVRDTGLNKGWDYDMSSGSKIKSGGSKVEVQEYCEPFLPNGVKATHVPFANVMDPEHMDRNRIFNLLNAPLHSTIVPGPRQDELDIGTLAFRARQEAVLGHGIGSAERTIEAGLHSGLNWAVISQQHATTEGHVDTSGLYTCIVMLAGVKKWAIRKTALDENAWTEDMDVDKVAYFVDLEKRDLNDLPGGAAAWASFVLFAGDAFYMPVGARHAVFTVTPSIMAGIHYYNPAQYLRSVCGWIASKFTSARVTNAEHGSFFSMLQSFATFWLPGFKKLQRELLPKDHTILRTLPLPHTKQGLNALVGMAIVIVFNDTLTAASKPYRGIYYESDRRSFKQIWTSVTKQGCVRASGCNVDYEGILKGFLENDESPWDDRWTCGGLAEILVHVARALVQLSLLWENNKGDFIDVLDEDGNLIEETDEAEVEKAEWLSPAGIHQRVISDLSSALGLPRRVVEKLVGKVQVSELEPPMDTLVPDFEWVVGDRDRSERPPSLWDAFYDGGNALERN